MSESYTIKDIKKLMLERLSILFKERGFKKKGKEFYRVRGKFLQKIFFVPKSYVEIMIDIKPIYAYTTCVNWYTMAQSYGHVRRFVPEKYKEISYVGASTKGIERQKAERIWRNNLYAFEEYILKYLDELGTLEANIVLYEKPRDFIFIASPDRKPEINFALGGAKILQGNIDEGMELIKQTYEGRYQQANIWKENKDALPPDTLMLVKEYDNILKLFDLYENKPEGYEDQMKQVFLDTEDEVYKFFKLKKTK